MKLLKMYVTRDIRHAIAPSIHRLAKPMKSCNTIHAMEQMNSTVLHHAHINQHT